MFFCAFKEGGSDIMRDERTLKMMENYGKDFFEEGLSPAEIGKKYGLSSRIVYKRLDEIADNLGVPRELLLKRPHDEHVVANKRELRLVKPISPVDLMEQMGKVIEELDKIKVTFDREIEKIEQQLVEIEKEEREWETSRH